MFGFVPPVFFYACKSDKFNLRTVSFHGCKQLASGSLESIVRLEFPGNLLHLDLRKLQRRLVQETWAKQVEIRRILPSSLVVYVQERTPSVILEMHGQLMIADREGILLDEYALNYGKLDMPVFKGAIGNSPETYRLHQEENTARIDLALAMLSELQHGSPAYTRAISEVDLSDPENLRILLVDDTVEISLGDRDFLKRFQTLMGNLDQYKELRSQYNDIASVDLRFDGQIIYRPRTAAAGHTRGADNWRGASGEKGL